MATSHTAMGMDQQAIADLTGIGQKLGMSSLAVEQARDLLSASLCEEQTEQPKDREWLACMAFIGECLAQTPAHQQKPGRLSEILGTCGVGLEDFLKELPVAVKRAEPLLARKGLSGQPLERRLRLRELQTSFVYSTVLAKKCKDLVHSYFAVSVSAQAAQDPSSAFHAAWLLFVTAKACLLQPYPDLVTSFNLLICVVNEMLAHMPAAERSVQLTEAAFFPIRTETNAVDTLQSLCLTNKGNLHAVRAVNASLDLLLGQAVLAAGDDGKAPLQPHEEHPTGGALTSCSYYPGWLSSPQATAAISQQLAAQYEQTYAAGGQVDERPFLERAAQQQLMAAQAQGPPSMTKCTLGTPRMMHGQRAFPSPMGRPAISKPMRTPSPKQRHPSGMFGLAQTPVHASLAQGIPSTPISGAMSAAAWLQDVATRGPAQPSHQLLRYFSSCDRDLTLDIAARVHQLADAVFPISKRPATHIHVNLSHVEIERREQGMKLYYRVLESMLKVEEQRTGISNFTSLLGRNSFHKCLLACAFETVASCYKIPTVVFPAILDLLELHAFDLCKIIDPFVRYEPTMPRDIRRHLFSIEEKILESMAWAQGSTLYPLLIMACGGSTPATSRVDGVQGRDSAGVTPSTLSPAESPRGEQQGSRPTTPSKRKSQDVTPEATPSKSRKSEARSSPTSSDQELMETSTDPARQPNTLAAVAAAAAAVATASGTPTMAREGLAADAGGQGPSGQGTPQRSSWLQGPAPSPHRLGTASAFSALMSPLRRTGSFGMTYASWTPVPGTVLPHSYGPNEAPAASQQPGVPEKPGRALVHEFLKKVLKLSLIRLLDLSDRLDFEPADRMDIVTQVYHMMQAVIFEHTALLYNRHLDQLLLSAIYGICKVNQLKQVSFKEIISHYRRQPQAKSDIFRTVVLAQSLPELQVEKAGDVIAFYNQVFVPEVKPSLMRLHQARATLPRPPTLSTTNPFTSPVRVQSRLEFPTNGFSTPPPANRVLGLAGGAKKVFVSPMRQSPKQALNLTPKGRNLYAFKLGGDGSNPFSSPSKDIEYLNGRIGGRLSRSALPGPGLQGPVEGGPAPSQSTERSSGADHSDSANQRASGSERHTSDSGDLRRQGSVSQEAAASAGLSMLQAAAAKAGGALQIAALGSPKVPPSVDAVNNSGGGPYRARHPAAKIGLRPDVRLGLAGSSI